MYQRQFVAWKRSAQRIGVATLGLADLFLCCLRTRRRLTHALGREWVRRNAGGLTLSRAWRATRVVLGVALHPAHRAAVVQRTRRLQRIAKQLAADNGPRYTIDTYAGSRVFFAALTRCLRAIAQEEVSPSTLERLAPDPGVARALGAWLSYADVWSHDVVAPPPAETGWLTSYLPSSTCAAFGRSRRIARQQEVETSYHIATVEVYDALWEQRIAMLALAEALLLAATSRSEQGDKNSRTMQRPIPPLVTSA
ncbi:MAG: hypothetical protein KDA61_15795 [Planctomycetales bacterium]|nr:hypothetical protein [Planctomycetales bacterium]